jgi:chitinase
MAYDLHGPWSSQTGIHAPLYSQNGLNVMTCVDYWLTNGMDSEKLILGIPLYGKSFTLDDPSQHGINALAIGPGDGGPLTNLPGLLGYNEVKLYELNDS